MRLYQPVEMAALKAIDRRRARAECHIHQTHLWAQLELQLDGVYGFDHYSLAAGERDVDLPGLLIDDDDDDDGGGGDGDGVCSNVFEEMMWSLGPQSNPSGGYLLGLAGTSVGRWAGESLWPLVDHSCEGAEYRGKGFLVHETHGTLGVHQGSEVLVSWFDVAGLAAHVAEAVNLSGGYRLRPARGTCRRL